MNTDQEDPQSASTTDIIAAVFVAVLIIFTLTGNLLVCASFYFVQELRTICNYFVVSLSAADVMVALLAMPFWCALQITHNQWNFGPHLKALWGFIDILCGTASIMNLTAVSIDRHFAITMPLVYPIIMSSRRAIFMITFVWIYALGVASLQFMSWPEKSAYMLFVACASFFAPLVVMLVMYLRIYAVAKQHVRRIGRNFAGDIKAAKTIAVVIGAFVVCWSPFFVVVLGFAFNQNFPIPNVLFSIIKWLEYLNSALNPMIYTCLNRTYRQAFRKFFAKCASALSAARERTDSSASYLSRRTARESLSCEANEGTEVARQHSPSFGVECFHHQRDSWV